MVAVNILSKGTKIFGVRLDGNNEKYYDCIKL